MDQYRLIAALRDNFNALEHALAEWHSRFSAFALLTAQIYRLPAIEKGTEHDAISHIRVTPLTGEAARVAGLAHFQRLFIHQHSETVSSKAAIRLPGALCFHVTQHEYREAQHWVDTINSHKAALERLITRESGLAAEHRFEFVHTHLPGLLTLSAYRSLTLLTEPDTVRFGWANKHVINTLTRDELLLRLEKSQRAERGIAADDKALWRTRITQEIIDIKRLPQDAVLKIKRPVKVQPIARVWYQAAQKQVQHPCPSPLLVLCCHPAHCPQVGELGDYDASTLRPKYKPQAKPLRLLIPRLHLYLDESA